jgi:cytidylate kinase
LGLTSDPEAVAELARTMALTHAIEFAANGDEQRVLLDGEDVSAKIRSAEVSMLASLVSAIPAVREALLDVQRDVGRNGRVVVEGRDIGTVVFPDAELKFFLTASVEQRATRRFLELNQRKAAVSLDEVQQEVNERDRRDSARPVAPLARASDAELIDSTGLGIDQVVDTIVARVRTLEASTSR